MKYILIILLIILSNSIIANEQENGDVEIINLYESKSLDQMVLDNINGEEEVEEIEYKTKEKNEIKNDDVEIKQIEVVKKVQPRYPTSPYAGGYIEGWVKLEVRVDHNGKAIEIQIINADPSRRFERSAKKALEQWEFSKSTKQEIRCGIIAMEFKLEN